VVELFPEYGFKREELKPIIERELAATNIEGWRLGTELACSDNYYDDAFNPRLIAIVNDTNSSPDARENAMEALARHPNEAGLKILKSLLDDTDVYDSGDLAWAIAAGYSYAYGDSNATPSRHLQPADFGTTEVRPLVERLLASTNEIYQRAGLDLAAVFDDDKLTPELIGFATNSGTFAQLSAIRALAFNRTDEGVKTLRALLHDPDERVASVTERSIRDAYTARGGARGKPLRPDDFDAKFQHAEITPAK
jgi:HEAT repeat protein